MDTLDNFTFECPQEFDFPFPPYIIQKEFMKVLYTTISQKKCGIFESPTGTGKTMSIICGVLRWLKDHNEQERKHLMKSVDNLQKEKEKFEKSSGDWLNLQSQVIKFENNLRVIKFRLNKILEYDEKLKQIKQQHTVRKERVKKFTKKSVNEDNDEDSLKKDDIDDEDMLISENLNNDNSDSDDENNEDMGFEPVRIYICSRTHSQLAQFVKEIIKSPFGKDARAVSLASRQIYCVNPEVKKLKSMALINERCLEMQKNDSKHTQKEIEGKCIKKQRIKNCKCPYFKQQNIELLGEIALAEIIDVEDLVAAGKELVACPYYASRKASNNAEIVLIPYNTLLHKATREANGIKLKNNVVIIDEAHNLLESLAQMYNSEVSILQLECALDQLKGYKLRFSTRFSSTNLLMINQIVFVITKLKQVLEKNLKNVQEEKSQIFTVGTFVLFSEIDNYNMFKLIKFAKDSKLSQKIHHFAKKFPIDEILSKRPVKKGVKDFLVSMENKQVKVVEKDGNSTEIDAIKQSNPQPVNPLLSIISFLEALTYSYEDGRILLIQNPDRLLCKLQFLVLNPSTHFKSIAEECRSVIVAGGTMKPMTEFRDRLFKAAGVEPDRIVEFSCDHIIPPENILPIILTKGLKGDNLLFNFDSRMKMGPNIKQILQDVCKKVQAGIVVFFPSYHYENWIWQQIKDVPFGRPVFREPKDTGSVDTVLEKYAESIRSTKKGALMLSVVGGKLSEGLNFSDDLGRCVIVIGLPYANIKAADLKEKMTFLDKKEGFGAGHKFYENLCMKSVNQCIGRAVRHKNDYATVLLVDERYQRNATKNALPGWIKRSLQVCDYKKAFFEIDKFFENK